MWMVTAAMKLKDAWLLGRKAMTNLDNCIKIQRHYFAYRCLSSQSCGFSNSHVQMSELYPKEGWAPKNSCFWTVVLEKTLESPLDYKEIQPVNSKGNQSWIKWKDWCWSWNANTLATWYKELTHWKRPWRWERLRAGGEEGNRGWDGWVITNSRDMKLNKLWEVVKDREAWHVAVHWISESDMIEWMNWTELKPTLRSPGDHVVWKASPGLRRPEILLS